MTGHRIRGAIVVYLLLGGLWSLLYQVVALTIPQAFRLPEGMAGGDPDALQRLMTYYSFITLTTTGYGDITPIHPVTRTLGHARSPGGTALPGHHPGPAGVFGRYVPKRKALKFSRSKEMRSTPMNQYQDVTSSSLAGFLLAAICLSACLVSGCGEQKATGPAAPRWR